MSGSIQEKEKKVAKLSERERRKVEGMKRGWGGWCLGGVLWVGGAAATKERSSLPEGEGADKVGVCRGETEAPPPSRRGCTCAPGRARRDVLDLSWQGESKAGA